MNYLHVVDSDCTRFQQEDDVLYDRIKPMVHDNILKKIASRPGRGLEAWRMLREEFEGQSALVVDPKLR